MKPFYAVLNFQLFINIAFCDHNTEIWENAASDTKCQHDYNSDSCPPFNPDEYLTTPQIIKRHGYEAESHIVETNDGFLLTMHRIPTNKAGMKGNQPIFLQHGLLSSSADWVDAGNKSLAFFLADNGYDVWLGNARGNTYSKAHVSLSPSSSQFWNFTWHEMGVYDLPAEIYYISNTTGKAGEILYIGHSMGTTMFFVFSSKFPQIAKHIKAMVALAPVAYMTHVRSPIRFLTPWVNDIEFIARFLGLNQFLPKNKIMQYLAYNCNLFKLDKRICENIIFLLCGFDKEQFNLEILPVVLAHVPAGTSTKTVLHYLQEIANEGKFQQFDYGAKGNMRQYGQLTPPLYKFENIKVPTYLMYGDNDLLASPIDVKRLAQNLTNNIGLYDVPLPNFNHVDFLFGKNATNLVYQPMLELLKNYTIYF